MLKVLSTIVLMVLAFGLAGCQFNNLSNQPQNTVTSTPFSPINFSDSTSIENFYNAHVLFKTPNNWFSIKCNNDIYYNPNGGVNSCATSPDAFAIGVGITSKQEFMTYYKAPNEYMNDSNFNESLIVGDKKTFQYDSMILAESEKGNIYRTSAIFYDDQTVIIVILHNLKYETIYQDFLNNISFH